MKLRIIVILAIIFALGLVFPQRGVIPVENATEKDWNPASFWYSPWGKSGVHKGVDIFAKSETPVVSSTSGIVILTAHIEMGGNVVVVLGPQWRIHYYAHLHKIEISAFRWVSRGEILGSVGNTGNAVGKPPHLHYSILSLMPYPWRASTQVQGWKKIFFMNPTESLIYRIN